MSGPKVVKLPAGFNRFPCPASNSALEGTIEVPLGTWIVDGKEEVAIHLRINARELPELVELVTGSTCRTRTFAQGAFQVFVAAKEN